MGIKTERLTLRVSDAFLEGLDELSINDGMSRSDLIRRAVALYSFAKEEERQGRKLGFLAKKIIVMLLSWLSPCERRLIKEFTSFNS